MKTRTLKLLFIFCILMGVILYKLIPIFTVDFTKFDKEMWNKYPDKRYEMIYDFELKYPTNELTKTNVVELLGEQNVTQTETMYSYTIGNNFMFTKHYALIFDEQGKCVDRYIYND